MFVQFNFNIFNTHNLIYEYNNVSMLYEDIKYTITCT